MPKSVVAEGKTTNEAIENGLKELNANRKDVDIKILENEDKRSFFSILAPRVVKVELTLREKSNLHENNNKSNNSHNDKYIKKEPRKFSQEDLDKSEKNVNNFLDIFLKKIGEDCKYEISKSENGLDINITGESAGVLIGYRGEGLYALRNILISIASKELHTRMSVILDIDGYKEKRIQSLENLADKLEKRVIKTRKSVTLEPMKPFERKVIHTRLQNSSKVETYSVGEEPKRRIVINLK